MSSPRDLAHPGVVQAHLTAALVEAGDVVVVDEGVALQHRAAEHSDDRVVPPVYELVVEQVYAIVRVLTACRSTQPEVTRAI